LSVNSITIETSTICNAHCIICPNHTRPRPAYKMSVSEFKLILEKFPRLKGVVLCGMYEPLSDPRIDEILTAIRYVQPSAEVTIFTNGALLTREMGALLLSHSTLKNVVVSIHGFSKKVYESVMQGLDRNRVYENVLDFMQQIGTNCEPHVSVSFVRIKQNIHELERFRKFWKDKVDTVSDFEVMNWNGQVADFYPLLYEWPKFTRPCPMFEQPLVIDAYGNVVKCCYDFAYNYGHVLKGGYEKWQQKKRESDTWPLADCISCFGWQHY